MSEVEQLAQEQFYTFRNRLCEIISEIEEEHRTAFIQGYAKGETDEKFRTKQVVTKHIAELEKENAELKAKIEKLKCCENCRFSIFDTDDLCVVGCNAGKCFNHEKWELQEG